MTDYTKLRKSVDMTDWMRTPQAQVFSRYLEEHVETAFKNMVATCEKSSDPKVTAACAKWTELVTLTTYLRNGRKESPGEDE